MRAHATLWVDDKGQLCEEPPDRGLKIAPTKGDEIQKVFVDRYGLSESKGKIVQKQAKAENKAVKEAPNKGGGGLSITREKPAGPEDSAPAGEKVPADPEAEVEPEEPKANKKKGSR